MLTTSKPARCSLECNSTLRVAALMTERLVARAVQRRMRGNEDDGVTAGLQQLEIGAKHLLVFRDVLQHVQADDRVDALGPKRPYAAESARSNISVVTFSR